MSNSLLTDALSGNYSPKLEQSLTRWLHTLTNDVERRPIIEQLLDAEWPGTLRVANKVMRDRGFFVWFLWQGMEVADPSGFQGWINMTKDRLGPRGIIKQYFLFAEKVSPRKAAIVGHWIWRLSKSLTHKEKILLRELSPLPD